MPCSGRDSGNRLFGYALLASFALHAALLAARWPSLADSLKAPVEALAPIVARLVEPAPPAPKPAPRPQTAAPKPRPPKPEPPKPKPAPKPQAAPAPIVPSKPEPAPPSVIATPAPTPPPAPAPAARATPADSAPPAAAAPDIDSLIAQYRAALLRAAGRYKRYPPMARDNGWEGEVVVRMSVGADGSIESLDVMSGSGYRVLDRQALDMFRRAGPQVAVPEALRGKAFTLEVRAIYSLKDQLSG